MDTEKIGKHDYLLKGLIYKQIIFFEALAVLCEASHSARSL